MILIQNMVVITGLIGFIFVFCFARLGRFLELHRVFSYYRKKNLLEVYRFIAVETICVSGFLCLIYGIFEKIGVLEPMGLLGILVDVLMIFLASLFCHGYAPILQGMAALFSVFLGVIPTAFILECVWINIPSNRYLSQIACVLFVIDLCVWGINWKLWKNANFTQLK